MTSSTVYKYRVYCNTDAHDEYVWAETEPTTCPINSTHTINPVKTRIVETREPQVVTVKEESSPTGGHFGCRTMKVTSNPSETSSVSVSFPFPISALCITFTTTEVHRGNLLDMSISKNTTIGAITAPVVPAAAWTSQNYVVGDKVLYTDTIGNRVYTCIQNTVSNETPSNKTYWILGYELNVSPTVLAYTQIGFFIRLDDLSQNDDMGQVIYKNTASNKIYVEYNPTNSYSPLTPTYVKQSVYMIKDYQIAEPWEHDIGQSKIGGASIPADTLITVDYINLSQVVSSIVGRVEYLY